MKVIIILSSVALFFLSASFADIKDVVFDSSTAEVTSVRNLPVIMENEVLSNGRCRLHLDTGVKIDVSCEHTAERFEN